MRIRAGQLLLVAGLVPAFAGIAAHTTWADVIPPETVGLGGNFTSLAAAAASEVAGNSYTFNLIAGTTFTDTQAFAVFAANTTINGNGDTLRATQPPSNEKGVLTTTSPLSVNNLSIIGTPGIGKLGVSNSGSGIPASPDGGNSSAIREQANGANTLNLTGVTISGFQMGVLTGSDSGNTHLDQVTVSNSTFMNNGAGFDPNFPFTFGHALYVGDALSLSVSNSVFCGQDVGHDVKSRAASTTVMGSSFYVGTNSGAPAGCNVGSTSNAIDIPNGGVGNIDMDQIFQGDANQNGSMIRYGEEGSPFATNTLDVSNTSFTLLDTKNGTAIDEPLGCGTTPNITSTGNTFTAAGTGNLTQVNPAGCGSSGPSGPGPGPVLAAVPEPSSLWLLLAALGGCAFWGLRARAV